MPFFCGVVQQHRESSFAKAGWGWPLSRVDLRESELFVYTPVLFGRWTLNVPYLEIDEAVVRTHRWGGRIRLHRRHGNVTLTTMGANYVKIGTLLRAKGVRVSGDDSPEIETA